MSQPSLKSPKSFLVDSLEVRVGSSLAGMAQDAAQTAQLYLREVLDRKNEARVILASANSQIEFLEAWLAMGEVDWSRVAFFHMDEYLGIEARHPASFRRFMRERVESRIHPRAFHYLEGDCLEPLAECERYTQLLKAQPIDLCCLGIGENGHLAFNDPPVAHFDDPYSVKLVKLDEACRQQQVGEGHYPNLAAVPQYALTLTIPMLCSAKRMLCIVPEQRKARAVKDTLESAIQPACPASILRRQKQCVLFLDPDSASLL